MINSRDLNDLHPSVKKRALAFLEACHKANLDVIVTSTYRDHESQNALYAQGRTTAGNPCSCGGKINKIGTCRKHPMGLKVTNAKAGQSWHNYRLAFDIAPLRYGKPVWGTSGNGIDSNPADDLTDDLELWQRVAALAKAQGLEWAGDWKTFREFPHFQWTGGLTLADLQAGKRPPIT